MAGVIGVAVGILRFIWRLISKIDVDFIWNVIELSGVFLISACVAFFLTVLLFFVIMY